VQVVGCRVGCRVSGVGCRVKTLGLLVKGFGSGFEELADWFEGRGVGCSGAEVVKCRGVELGVGCKCAELGV